MTWLQGWALGGLCCAALACAGTEPPNPATQLVKASGEAQSWYFNNPLPEPYGVIARDAASQPVAGVVVGWTVTSGAGSVEPQTTTTDANGVAEATHTLGPEATIQTVSAAAAGLPPLTFTANASAPLAEAGVQVADDFFSPRNVAVQLNSTVTWTWTGANPHSVTFTGGTPSSDTYASGPPYTRTFTTTATFEYFCKVHAGMNGSVVVVK